MEEVINSNIALYAAIKTFHGKGHDMWSAVSSLTLIVVEQGTERDLQSSFRQVYQIDAPIDALKTVLSRLKRNGYISYEKGYISVTPKGEEERNRLNDSLVKVKREYSTLTKDFKQYLVSKGVKKLNNVDTILLDFIDDNIGFTSDIVATTKGVSGHTNKQPLIAEYLLNLEQSNAILFDIFQNVFFGRIYLTLIKKRTQLNGEAKFDKLTIYLDTNIVLSLIGLRNEMIVRSSQELLKILKSESNNITVAVLEETVDEALLLLNSYANNPGMYVDNLKVDNAKYRMSAQRIDRQDLLLLIENFQDRIEEMGIEVHDNPKLDSDTLSDTENDISRKVKEIDAQKNVKALKHDAVLIESVKKIRGRHRTHLLEKSRAVFVTPDQSLIAYSKEDRFANSFPLAIRPVDIVSLLWVKAIGSNGKFDGSMIRLTIMGYVREKLIRNELWALFTTRLAEAKEKGDMSEDDIAKLLASDETEKLLTSDIPDGEIIKKLTDPSNVRRIRLEQKSMQEKNIKNTQKIHKLKTELVKKDTHIASSEDQIDRVYTSIRSISNWVGNFMTIAFTLFLVGLGCLVLNYVRIATNLDFLFAAVPFGLLMLGFVLQFVLGFEFKTLLFRNRLKVWISKCVYSLLCKLLRIKVV